MSTSNDGSESVDQFLARIASIKEGRDEVSEERTKRMEEDFQKSRKERQARRLERARSLSPSKTGPARSNSVLSSPAPIRDIALNPPVDFSPQNSTLSRSNAVRTSPTLAPKQHDSEAFSSPPPAIDSPINTSTLSRSGTLSWQQRPSPQDRNLSRPRPLSSIATVRPVSRDGEQSAQSQEEPTRQEIAASLASRDPTWFKQTQDRGTSSAAFRKNQVEDTPTIDSGLKAMRLPGLSSGGLSTGETAQDRSMETPTRERPLPTKPATSPVVRTPDSGLTSPEVPFVHNSASPSQSTENRSDIGFERPERASSTAARSPSPTKGLGGFVQSAMMKRSDSVNKRWSVQATGGLKRGDSVAGMRPLSGLGPIPASMRSREVHSSQKDGSISPVASRPGSSQEIRPTPVKAANSKPRSLPQAPAVQERPSEIVASSEVVERSSTPATEVELNRSPSKTLDARRWSPTKSSWLESTLLSKPEPPKMTPKKEDQPRWKVDLQRSRSRRDASPEKSVKLVGTDKTKSPEPPISSILPHKSLDLESPSTTQESKQPEKSDEDGVPRATERSADPEEEINSQEKVEAINPASLKHSSRMQSTLQGSAMRDSAIALPEPKLDKKPPEIKPKPQTPPKTDFRASLRPRVAPAADDGEAEPEFKAIFGKLKSAQTKNYVAPDVLKGNIMSGKAALALTGGPQKTKRVDEFKESILQKKEAMKVVAETKKQEPVQNVEPQKSEAPLPEALARRRTLHKASPSVTKFQESLRSGESATTEPKSKSSVPYEDKDVTVRPAKPEVNATSNSTVSTDHKSSVLPMPPGKNEVDRIPASKDLPKPLVPPKTIHARSSADQLKETSSKQGFVDLPPQKTEDGTNDVLKKAALPSNISVSQVIAKSQPPTTQVADSGAMPNNKLASRLNPNLAALLTRSSGPRPTASSSPSTEDVLRLPTGKAATSSVQGEENSGELTHATKARAKGPKRRAPKAQTTMSKSAPSSPLITTAMTTETIPPEPTMSKLAPQSRASTFPKPALMQPDTIPNSSNSINTEKPIGQDIQMTQAAKSTSTVNTPAKSKPTVVAKSPELRRVSSSLSQQTNEQMKPNTPKKFEIAIDKAAPISNPQNTTIHRFPSPKPAISPKPLTTSKSRINTAKPPQANETSTMKSMKSDTITGLGLTPKPVVSKPIPPIAVRQPVQFKADSKIDGSSIAPTNSDAAAVSDILNHYFETRPRAAERAEYDAPALLIATKEQATKLKTVSKNIWEIASGGKKTVMPAQQEHILYEDTMYLVLHTCESLGGSKVNEVYLWCGDRVSEGAIEDIQLFCKRDAREYNAKLEIIKQGKEPARFFQALGDIVVVRRSKSSALYMLCGRRHMGCMAFDEVDFSVENLCSGFPYLISAKFGKLYLWKGKGSAADEVGCARLIGTDIGLTGEIEEVEEGAETDLFWEAFSENTTKRVWAREWQQRAEHNAFPPTLYRIEHDRPKSAGSFWGLRSASPPKSSSKANIELLEPFCHRDMDSSNVYVLDAYRSVYVLLGSKPSSKTAEFTTALHLAQEIAMLSPSIQGRSLMPACYVSFGEPPADVKACFRKWPTEKKEMKNDKPSACVRLEDVMLALGI